MTKLLISCFFIILGLLTALLFLEYQQVRQQLLRVSELQEEYQNYTSSFRKILRDYQRAESEASDEDEEKKKESITEQPFLVVNREPDYLHDSMKSFLKKQRMETLLDRMYAYDEMNTANRKKRNSRTNSAKRSRASRRSRSKDASLLHAQISRHHSLYKKPKVQDIHFEWPIDRSSFWISSFYGARRNPNRTWGFHNGIDLAAIKGTPVKSVEKGVVIEAGHHRGYGNTIVIMHNDKYQTRYAHLHRMYVHVGQHVDAGQRIGAVGDTGHVRKHGKYASHLHLEVYVYGKKVDPMYFFLK